MKILLSTCRSMDIQRLYPKVCRKWHVSDESIVMIASIECLQRFLDDLREEANVYVDGLVIWSNTSSSDGYQMRITVYDGYLE